MIDLTMNLISKEGIYFEQYDPFSKENIPKVLLQYIDIEDEDDGWY